MKGGDELNKFAGVGLKNVLVIGLLTIILIIVLKTIFTKYPVEGVTDVVHAI